MSDPFFYQFQVLISLVLLVCLLLWLPHVSLDEAKIQDVKIGIIGVPWDSGQQTDQDHVMALDSCETHQP